MKKDFMVLFIDQRTSVKNKLQEYFNSKLRLAWARGRKVVVRRVENADSVPEEILSKIDLVVHSKDLPDTEKDTLKYRFAYYQYVVNFIGVPIFNLSLPPHSR